MVEATVSLYPEIFRHYYPNLSDEKIVDSVINKKGRWLIDLLYIAADDINRAKGLVVSRGYRLGPPENLGHLGVA